MRRYLLLPLLAASLAGCFRDRDAAADSDTLTAEEIAEFTAPADSTLAPGQVDEYLRTLSAQALLVREEAPAFRERIAAGGDGRPAMAQWSDFLRGTYIRGAREAGAQAAEMDYVRSRVAAVGGYLLAKQTQAASPQYAESFRQQAEIVKSQPGGAAQAEALLRAAEQAEAQAAPAPTPRIRQNLEVLLSGRATVSEATWTRIATASGGSGLMGLGDPSTAAFDSTVAALGQLCDEVRESRGQRGR